MPITQKTLETTVEYDLNSKVVFVESVTVFEDNGVEVARTAKHRRAVPPGADDTNESPAVKAVASLRTPADVAAYRQRTQDS